MILPVSDRPAPGSARPRHRARACAARAALAVAALTTAGCSSEDPDISRQLAHRVAAQPDGPVDLAQIGPADWDKVCVLGPYTLNAQAEAVLGFAWDAERRTRIAATDDIVVLVFVRGADVRAYTQYPRRAGDLAGLQPPCLPRTRAQIVRRTDARGWMHRDAQQPPR